MLLSFRDDEGKCPCPLEIQERLQDFHHLLKTHCGRKQNQALVFLGEERLFLNDHNGNASWMFLCAGIESEGDGEEEEATETSVKNQLLSQVARVIGLNKKASEVAESKPVTTSMYWTFWNLKMNPSYLNYIFICA